MYPNELISSAGFIGTFGYDSSITFLQIIILKPVKYFANEILRKAIHTFSNGMIIYGVYLCLKDLSP